MFSLSLSRSLARSLAKYSLTHSNILSVALSLTPHTHSLSYTHANLSRYLRMEVYLGGSVLRPLPGNPNRTLYTTLAHVNPGACVCTSLLRPCRATQPHPLHHPRPEWQKDCWV